MSPPSFAPPQAGRSERNGLSLWTALLPDRRMTHNRVMLRLDPAHPPVWSSDTRLQFGVDPVVVLEDPLPWQERLVHALQSGILPPSFPALAAASGAAPADAEEFLLRLQPALLPLTTSPARAVSLHIQDGFPQAQTDAFVAAFEASGRHRVSSRWYGTYEELDALESVVVLLADHLVEPRRAAALLSRDIVHLPVVFTADRAEVGPLVTPGDGPCLACIEAHRRDADAAWPRIAAQLVGLHGRPMTASLVEEAGLIAARLISEPGALPPRGRSLLIHADSLRRRWRSHRPHAECRCRSLARSGTDPAPGCPRPVPTTVPASAPRG